MIIGKFKNIVSVVAIAAKMLNIINATLLPLVINFPPSNDPVTTPKTAALLIIVL